MLNIPPAINLWLRDSLKVFVSLCKIMIPVIIILKLIEPWGITKILADWLAPTMALLGLPGYTGIVWATAIVGNIYGGLAVLATLWVEQPLTIAQVSILSLIILIAHSLIIECLISQRSGSTLWFTFVWRIINAYFIGWIVYLIVDTFSLFQQSANFLLEVTVTDNSLDAWFWSQVKIMVATLFIAMLLVGVMQWLSYVKIEKYLHQLLKPFLKIFSLPPSATNITIIGMLLGISYGGGLLMQDINNGVVSRKDGAVVMSILNLNHSIFEDTALMFLVGSTLWIILVARLFFGLIISWIFSQILQRSVKLQSWTVSKAIAIKPK